ELGRGPGWGAGLPAEPDRVGAVTDGRDAGVGQSHQRAARREVAIGAEVVGARDRRGRHAGALQGARRLFRRPLAGPARHAPVDLVARREPTGEGREARLVAPAEAAPEA